MRRHRHPFDHRPLTRKDIVAATRALTRWKRPPPSPDDASPPKRQAAHNSRSHGSPPLPPAGQAPTAAHPAPQPEKPPKIPLFFIDGGVSDWPKLADKIQRLAPGTECLFRGSSYRVKTPDVEGFRAVQKALYLQGASFHTFSFKGGGPLKVVIRGLPEHLDQDEVIELLRDFAVDNVVKLRNRRGLTKCWLVSIMDDDEKEEDQRPRAEIYKLTHLYHVKIFVAAFRKPAGPPQCHRCQRFGHGSGHCNMPLRCVRCGGPHRRQDCLKPTDEVGACINCGEQHNASYRGCKAYKNAQRPLKPPTAKETKQPARPPPPPEQQDTAMDVEDTDGATNYTVVKRRKRPPRNPANRGRQKSQPRPEQHRPADAAQPRPAPPPKTERPAATPRQPARPASATRPAAAEQATPLPAPQPELRDIMALLAEVLAQLTSLTGLLTSLLPQLRKD